MVCFKLFTDGGAFKKENGNFTAVSSFILIKDNELVISKQEIHEDKTNNYAEIYSIAKGLENILEYIRVAELTEFNVQVYSDSLLCVKSLTEWIFKWLKTAKNGIFYTTTGEPVANQELIKEAFKIIFLLKKRIRIFHINSHEPKYKLQVQYKKFKKVNKVDISYEDFLFAYLNNKKCDDAIQEAYKEYIKNKNSVNSSVV